MIYHMPASGLYWLIITKRSADGANDEDENEDDDDDEKLDGYDQWSSSRRSQRSMGGLWLPSQPMLR